MENAKEKENMVLAAYSDMKSEYQDLIENRTDEVTEYLREKYTTKFSNGRPKTTARPTQKSSRPLSAVMKRSISSPSLAFA